MKEFFNWIAGNHGISDMELPKFSNIDEYIELRLDDQIRWYDRKAQYCRKWHERNSVILTIFTSAVTVMTALSLADFPEAVKTTLTVAATSFSAVCAIILAIDRLKNFNELHTQYRLTCQRLIQERTMYLTKSGEYTDSPETKEKLLIQRCESIMSTETGNWVEINEKPAEKSQAG